MTHLMENQKQAGEILAKAASYCGFSFFNLILSRIFLVPSVKPNYIPFYCYLLSDQLIHGETPKIIKDEKVPTIYVESVVYHFLNQI